MVVTAAIGEALVFFVFKKKNRIPLQARSVQRIEREKRNLEDPGVPEWNHTSESHL